MPARTAVTRRGRRGSSASPPRAASSAWFVVARASGAPPNGLRDLSRVRPRLRRPGDGVSGCCSPTATRAPTPAPSGRSGACSPHPVRLVLDDDGRRSRLTVLFRLLLALPHLVWLALWTLAAILGCDCERGRRARRAAARPTRCIASSARTSVTRRTSAPSSSSSRTRSPASRASRATRSTSRSARPEQQNRWVTLFRLFLVLPALVVAGALGGRARGGRLPRLVRRTRDRPDAGPACATSVPSACATSRRRTRTGSSSPTATRTPAQPWTPPAAPEPAVEVERLSRTRGLQRPREALVAAAVWALAAYLLWDSRVPDGLSLPPVEADRLIDPATIDRAERYEMFFRVEFVVSQLVLLGVLIALRPARRPLRARVGGRSDRHRDAARNDRTGARLDLAVARSGSLAVWWNRRYDQTDSGYVETLFANWLELGAEFLFVCFALVIVMAIAGRFPRRWWLAAAPVFVALAALFAFVFPYLSSTEPLRRPGPPGGRARGSRRSRESSRSALRGRGRDRLHQHTERVCRRLRAVEADRLLEHAPGRPLR